MRMSEEESPFASAQQQALKVMLEVMLANTVKKVINVDKNNAPAELDSQSPTQDPKKKDKAGGLDKRRLLLS